VGLIDWMVMRSQPSVEERLERDGTVTHFVMGGVHERDPSTSGRAEKRLPGGAMRTQLGEVPVPKLQPLLRIVAEPLSQVRARRDLLEPVIELQACFRYTPGPQSLHEN